MSMRGGLRLVTTACVGACWAGSVLADPQVVDGAAAPMAFVEPGVAVAPVAVAAAVIRPVLPPKPAITLQAKADLTRQTLTVTENNRTVAVWPISSGVEDHPTPRGVFQPEWTAKMWFSRKYDDAPMPHAVFFKDGAAIHATQAVGRLGQAASHGCVRLAPSNAETFYRLVQRHGLAHVRISVFGVPRATHPAMASQPAAGRRLASAVNVGGNSRAYGWSSPGQYAAAGSGPFAAPGYTRLPIGSIRMR